MVTRDSKEEYRHEITALPDVMRYKNPTPNPLPASEEGAIMYFMYRGI